MPTIVSILKVCRAGKRFFAQGIEWGFLPHRWIPYVLFCHEMQTVGWWLLIGKTSKPIKIRSYIVHGENKDIGTAIALKPCQEVASNRELTIPKTDRALTLLKGRRHTVFSGYLKRN